MHARAARGTGPEGRTVRIGEAGQDGPQAGGRQPGQVADRRDRMSADRESDTITLHCPSIKATRCMAADSTGAVKTARC